jgi:hypothetical protein
MCQRWAGTACVDYHNSCHNDTVEKEGLLESTLEPIREKTSDYK